MSQPTTRTQRSCDQLGVCHAHTTPCNGCQAAPRRSHRICSADQCQQGRAPCPCPDACQLPTDDGQHHPLADKPATALETAALLAMLAAAAVSAAVIVVNLAPGA